MVGVAARLELRVVQLLDRVVGEEAQVHDDSGHDTATVRAQQAAVVGGLKLRELLDVCLDVVRDAMQDDAPFGRGEGCPRGESSPSGSDGRISFSLTAASDLSDE